jgi:hypothetical protein
MHVYLVPCIWGRDDRVSDGSMHERWRGRELHRARKIIIHGFLRPSLDRPPAPISIARWQLGYPLCPGPGRYTCVIGANHTRGNQPSRASCRGDKMPMVRTTHRALASVVHS